MSTSVQSTYFVVSNIFLNLALRKCCSFELLQFDSLLARVFFLFFIFLVIKI